MASAHRAPIDDFVHVHFTVKNMKLMDGHNPRPVLSFQPILIVGTLFGITPIYDYKIRKLAHEKLYICFALFAVCLVIVCSVILTRGRFILYEEAPATLRVLDTVVDMSGVILYVISSLGSTFWNMKTWDKLINQLCQLERWVYLENAGTRKSFTRRYLLSFFIGGSLLYVILVIYQFLYMRHIFIYYITQISLNYMVYVLIYIIYNITFSIKTSYDDLNHMLLMVNTINITTKEATKTIRKVRIRSLEIDSVIDTFNTLFGWPILLLVAHSFGQILTCISLFTTGLHHELFIRLLILYHFFANMVSNE